MGIPLRYIADFRGRENNQSSGCGNPRFLGDLVISGPWGLIVFWTRSGPVGFVSAFASLWLPRCISRVSTEFSRPAPSSGPFHPCFGLDFSGTLPEGFGPENNQHPGARVMDGSQVRRFFLEPEQTCQRQYEALRAIFIDDQPLDRVAERFGYKPSALRSMASRLRADCRRGVAPPFFARTAAGGLPARVPARSGRTPRPPTSPTVAN